MKVGFCCRSGLNVGFGHLSRTVQFAKAFQNFGDDVLILNQGPWPGFLETSVEISDSFEALVSGCDVVIFDGVDSNSPEKAAGINPQGVRVQVDDTGSVSAEAHIIINPNIYGDRLNYPAGKAVFAGPDYNLLAPELFVRDGVVSENNSAVVSFGGSDDGCYGFPAARGLSEKAFNVTLLLAREETTVDGAQLDDIRQRGVTVLFNQSSTPFLKCNRLYVGAAGVTSLEALAAGCAIAVCSIVENQQMNVAVLRDAGMKALDHFNAERLIALAGQVAEKSSPTPSLIKASGTALLVKAIHHCVNDLRLSGRSNAHAGLRS